MKNKPILIVAGEPYSVFIEIFLKALKKNKVKKKIILIVSQSLFLKQMKRMNYNFKINLINKHNIDFKKLSKNQVNIIDVNFKYKKVFDKITDRSNYYIHESFKIALKLILSKKFIGLINGPISKKNFLKKKSLGITEYLAEKTNRKNKVSMLIFNKKLSVCPITTHLPVKDIYKTISIKKIVHQVKLIDNFFKKEFKRKPKIAITGLNPHCESNYTSSEEDRIIKPAIKNLFKKKYNISGPFSADTIFMKQVSKNYDVIIGMYHDQVLTPAKTIFGFDSINITLGLPFIRISPDHGPNNTMLGKNKSNPQSLIKALEFLDR
jgi:4-hydroxythreonine-4-phosphate dehydrogenase